VVDVHHPSFRWWTQVFNVLRSRLGHLLWDSPATSVQRSFLAFIRSDIHTANSHELRQKRSAVSSVALLITCTLLTYEREVCSASTSTCQTSAHSSPQICISSTSFQRASKSKSIISQTARQSEYYFARYTFLGGTYRGHTCSGSYYQNLYAAGKSTSLAQFALSG
jgi:hypothetical protein